MDSMDTTEHITKQGLIIKYKIQWEIKDFPDGGTNP